MNLPLNHMLIDFINNSATYTGGAIFSVAQEQCHGGSSPSLILLYTQIMTMGDSSVCIPKVSQFVIKESV